MDTFSTGSNGHDQARDSVNKLASTAHKGVDKVADTLNDVSGTLSTRTRQINDAYHRVTETGLGYVRTNPGTSLLVALAAGYGLSKLFGSRH